MDSKIEKILIQDDFLTDEECDYIIALAETLFEPSTLMGEEHYVGYGRSSRSAFLVFRLDEILTTVPHTYLCLSNPAGIDIEVDTFGKTSLKSKSL